MMKKLLLLISVMFLLLFSNVIKAQVTIDSVVISNPITCFGDLADIDVYVDNDTNTTLGGGAIFCNISTESF